MPKPLKEEELDQITKKVYALYAKHGFAGISMDEVSRQTNISKATLYRYFNSKEDIVRGMVDYMIIHLDSVQFNAIEQINDVMTGLREFYIKSVYISSLTGSAFLGDLKNKFPDCYESYRESGNALGKRFSDFYQRSAGMGYFRNLSFALVMRQFGNTLPSVTDMDFLEKNKMTLREALKEYYRMFYLQILSEEYLGAVDTEETCDFVEELAGVLLNDYFIDSIRR